MADGLGDAWPRTNRAMPWLIAVFLVMLWLLPFDSIQANVSSPIDLKLDRLLLSTMILIWLASIFAGGRTPLRWHRGPVDVALLLVVGVAVASVILNFATLAVQHESALAFKKLALLLSYATFFFTVATSLRREEVGRFLALFVGLAVVTSIGTLYQYWGGQNLFYTLGDGLFPDALFTFTQPEASKGILVRPITGPAGHALALAAMFGIAVSAAVVYLLRAPTLRQKLFYGAITGVILLGVFATSRKTGSFAAIAAGGVLIAYRPKEFGRYIPAFAAVFVALLLFAPNAVEKQIDQIQPGKIAQDASGKARAADYEAVIPDLRQYLVTGRGYGTYDNKKYRTLDNQWLGLLIETGLLGVAAFALLILAVLGTARRLSRDRDLERAAPALAATGGAVAFAVCMALFDALAFPQAPYLFLFLAGLLAVARSPVAAAPVPAPAAHPADATEDPLPPLRDRLPAVARRDAHAAVAGGGAAPGRRRRDHSVAPAPVAADDARRGSRVRSGVLARLDGGRARNGIVALLLLGFVAAVFTAGGQPDREAGALELGSANSAEDPFGLDEYEQGAGRAVNAAKPHQALRDRIRGDGASAPAAASAPPAAVSIPPFRGREAPQQEVAGEMRESSPSEPRAPRDQRFEDDKGGNEKGEDKNEPGEPRPDPKPAEDCPIENEGAREIIRQVLDRDPCGEDALDRQRIRDAFIAGKLDRSDIELLEHVHRETLKAAAPQRAADLRGGFTLLLVGGGALTRRRLG